MRHFLKRLTSMILSVSMVATMGVSAMALQKPSNAADLAGRLSEGYSDERSKYEIYPVPHSVAYEGDENAPPEFTMTSTVNVVREEGIDHATLSFLKEILDDYGVLYTESSAAVSDKTNILLGVHDSGKYVDQYMDAVGVSPDLFQKIDAYALNASAVREPKGTIAILGKDSASAYYGLATLKMMFSSFHGTRFLSAKIEDYSSSILRGFIEGFYGSFDYASRESQMRSIRDVKGNLYVFASKTDPYHGGNKWGDLYPQEEINQIKHLVEVGQATKVRYAWSVHIGKAGFFTNASSNPADGAKYTLYQERLGKLKAKFDQLYSVGVRDFHVLNDDYNSGSYADVVNLLNELNAYLKTKGDCGPIVYCPNGYNTSWAGNFAELQALKGLDQDIYLYWTGSDVNSPITQQNLDVPYTQSGHYPVTWLNYPCDEHAKSGIFLGSIYQYIKDADGVTGQMGLLSNPVNYPEANKVAYFQLLSWAWNHDHYSSYQNKLWEDSFQYLQPEVADSYLTISRNVSNCPGSGRYPQGFPESEYLKELLDSVRGKATSGTALAGDQQTAALLAEFENILSAVVDFRANCANAALVAELNPWLSSLTEVATAGKNALASILALQSGDLNGAWSGLSKAGSALSKWDSYKTPNYAEMAKAGSLRLQPFAASLITYAGNALMPLLNPAFEGFTPSIYSSYSASNDANTQKMFDANEATYTSWNVVQKIGDYYGVDLGRVINVHDVSIVQGETDTHHDRFHESVLEYSADGKKWTPIIENINAARISAENLNISARYIRLRVLGFTDPNQPGKKDFWTRVREFTVNRDTTQTGVYTNVEALKGCKTEQDGMNVALKNIGGVTLKPGEYLGIKLSSLSSAATVTAVGSKDLAASLAVEYSQNSVVWKPASGLTAGETLRYARLYNNTAAPVSFDLTSLQITLSTSKMKPTVSSNIASLKEGAWENLVDGNTSTNVWTSVVQAAGQYVQVDLGANVPFETLALYMSDGKPRLYHAAIKTSLDGSKWTTVKTVDSDADSELIPPYRIVRANGSGDLIRYVQIEITAPAEASVGDPWLNLFELKVNDGKPDSVPSVFSGRPAGAFENAMDGSLATAFTPKGDLTGGFFQYMITEKNDIGQIVILQNPDSICNAAVEVETVDGWSSIGTLNQSSTTLQTSGKGALLNLRLKWQAGEPAPSIYEIFLVPSGGAPQLPNILSVEGLEGIEVDYGTKFAELSLPDTAAVHLSDGSVQEVSVDWEAGSYNGLISANYTLTGRLSLPNGITNNSNLTASITVTVKPSEEEIKNLSLRKPVTVSGTETAAFPGELAVDGDTNTRWCSGFMKQAGYTEENEQTPQWIVVDLGEGIHSVSRINASYFNKVYPTKYEIQTSNDQNTWSTVKTFDKPHNGPTYPTDVTTFEQPLTARYVRLYFTQMNVGAAGHAIGLTELEIMGTHQDIRNIVSIASFDDLTAANGTAFADLKLPANATVTLDDRTSAALPVVWSAVGYDPETAGIYTITGALTVPGAIANPQNLTASIRVIVQEKVVAPVNLALNKPVEVSGLEVSDGRWTGAKAVDGDKISADSRWSSGLMKKSGASASDPQTEQWIVVDLGEGDNTISQIIASYYLKVYPTQYQILLSDNKTDWQSVKTLSHPHNGSPDPVDTIDFAEPVHARYVKLLFQQLNVNAAGNALSLRELEIMGAHTDAPALPSITEVSAIEGISVENGTAFAALSLPDKAAVTLSDSTTAALPVVWSDEGYRATVAGTYVLTGILTVPDTIANPQNLTASIAVTVKPLPAGNKSELKKVIDTASAYSMTDYVDDQGKIDFLSTLEVSKALFATDGLTQTEIDKAISDLLTAMNKLRLRADKTNLFKWLETLDAIDLTQYTAESADVLLGVLARAEALAVQDLGLSESGRIDAMIAELEMAQKNLQLRTDSQDPVNPAQPGEDDPQSTPEASDVSKEQVKETASPAPSTGDSVPVAALSLLALAAGVLVAGKKRKG